MQYYIDHCPTERGPTYLLAKEFGQTLLENCREMMDNPPLYKDSTEILSLRYSKRLTLVFIEQSLSLPLPKLL